MGRHGFVMPPVRGSVSSGALVFRMHRRAPGRILVRHVARAHTHTRKRTRSTRTRTRAYARARPIPQCGAGLWSCDGGSIGAARRNRTLRHTTTANIESVRAPVELRLGPPSARRRRRVLRLRLLLLVS